jgi:hypothetical protein
MADFSLVVATAVARPRARGARLGAMKIGRNRS